MTETAHSERNYKILVFGIEKLRLPTPKEPIKGRNFSVFFEPYTTPRRFHEYDGVVAFQGIFEKFERKSNLLESYLSHTFDADELDKRKKESHLLIEKGGFFCFLLIEQFLDNNKGHDFSGTDLAKHHLSRSGLYRKNFRSRAAHVESTFDEFKRFLQIYGAASSYFQKLGNSFECSVLAKVEQHPVGLLIDRQEYFIPSLVPDARPDVISEYFNLLIDAVTSLQNKLHTVIPDWAKEFQFHEETSLTKERVDLAQKVANIDHRLELLNKFKAALVQTGAELAVNICAILTATLGTKVDSTDEFREDLKVIDENGKTIAVCEVKGVNRGIKRENINQTDSHRERSGFDDEFPAILIVNTNIKAARSLAEKNQEIATEQVKHAAQMRILLMRTIDLLGLLRLVLCGKQTPETARALVLSNAGWLRVDNDDVSILKGE